jgi:hypothetical protein
LFCHPMSGNVYESPAEPGPLRAHGTPPPRDHPAEPRAGRDGGRTAVPIDRLEEFPVPTLTQKTRAGLGGMAREIRWRAAPTKCLRCGESCKSGG